MGPICSKLQQRRLGKSPLNGTLYLI